jgi:hypothetical protein
MIGGPFQRSGLTRNFDWRGIALQLNAISGDPDVNEASDLILAERLEAIDTPAPEQRQPIDRANKKTSAAPLSYGAFRMEIRYAVDKLLAQNEVGRCNPMQEQGRAAREKDCINTTHQFPQSSDESRVDTDRPQDAARVRGFVVTPRRQLNLPEPASTDFGCRIATTTSR